MAMPQREGQWLPWGCASLRGGQGDADAGSLFAICRLSGHRSYSVTCLLVQRGWRQSCGHLLSAQPRGAVALSFTPSIFTLVKGALSPLGEGGSSSLTGGSAEGR